MAVITNFPIAGPPAGQMRAIMSSATKMASCGRAAAVSSSGSSRCRQHCRDTRWTIREMTLFVKGRSADFQDVNVAGRAGLARG